jgi:hypothetical protein
LTCLARGSVTINPPGAIIYWRPPATGLLPKRCTTAALHRSEPSRDTISVGIPIAAANCSDNLNF